MHQIQHTTRESPSREQVLQVRRWLKVAEEHGEIPELPAIKWTIPPKQKGQQHKAHDRAVIDAWLDALCAWRPAAGLVARWVYATGWRIGDALDLRIDELDLERGIIDRAQLKTSSALDYPITPALRALLDQALKRHPKNPDARAHVFLNHKRQPWSYPQIYRLLQGYNKRGADITFRDLRKSFGTHLAMEGCPPNVLKELMGHGDIAMTLSYYVDVDLARMAQWSTRHTKTIAKTKTPVSAQVSKPKRPGK